MVARPHPLLQSPKPLPLDLQERVESYLAQWRQELKLLESGDMGLGPDGAATVVLVTLHKRIIARYEAILAELEKDSAAMRPDA